MKYTFVICPHCGKKLFKIDQTSMYRNIYVWCKTCKKEILLTEPLSQDKK